MNLLKTLKERRKHLQNEIAVIKARCTSAGPGLKCSDIVMFSFTDDTMQSTWAKHHTELHKLNDAIKWLEAHPEYQDLQSEEQVWVHMGIDESCHLNGISRRVEILNDDGSSRVYYYGL